MIRESEMCGDLRRRRINAAGDCPAVALVHGPNVAASAEAYASPVEGEKTSWHGFDRHDFVMDEQTLAITALEAATDDADAMPIATAWRSCARSEEAGPRRNPRSLCDLYRDHQPPAETDLLARGYHLALITPGRLGIATPGSPS